MIGKNIMQISYGLYRCSIVDLAYSKEPVEKYISSGLIHAKETSCSIKRKVVKDNQTHQSNNFYLKSFQNSIQLCTDL